ncbi:MAG: MATE family efflux transporter [Anaerotignum sp.]|nr:MATE family efflux transporter [Anaerotignum sp.]MBQ7085404.1 MATE family efflux transporter [Anaerotignum sp.]
MITDLTQGDTRKMLWMFSIPMLLSVAFQQMYHIVDSIIAGRFIGEHALAAVGASHPITMVFMAVAVGSNIGCAVVVSGLFGAREYGKLKTVVCTIFITCIAASVIMTVLGLLAGDGMLSLIKTPADVFADASVYLKIYILGYLFSFLYNICNGVFTSLGDSRTPLYFLIGSSIGNIVLDLIFVIWLDMGVAGVAWATFAAQGAACILAFFPLIHRLQQLKTEEPYEKFSLPMLKQVTVIAVPSILQQCFISIGNVFVQSAVNSFGSAVVAGFSACQKLNVFCVTCMTTLSNGLSSFTAQNLGAKKTERVTEGWKAGSLLGVLICVPFFLFYFFCSETAMGLFLEADSTEAIQAGVDYLKIVTPFYFIVIFKVMCDGVLRGSSAMLQFMTGTFADLFLRVAFAFLFSKGLGFGETGIWMAWPIGWTLSTLISYNFYRQKPWIKEKEA